MEKAKGYVKKDLEFAHQYPHICKKIFTDTGPQYHWGHTHGSDFVNVEEIKCLYV